MEEVSANDAFRFVLELAALGALGYWGWSANAGLVRYAAAVGVPLVAAALWGTFRVANDPGPAPVPVPGPVRLTLELFFFAVAVGLLADAGQPVPALVFAGLLVLHYAVAHERVLRLLSAG